jgi:hypothetical protein
LSQPHPGLIHFQRFKSDKPAYRLVTGESKKTEFSKMLKEAIEADVVFSESCIITLSVIGYDWSLRKPC